jgi:uncharacterized membrane protein YqjE
MSGRHSGRTSDGLRLKALPKTLRLVIRLLPRQINDEIALAKVEIRRKGIELGTAAAFFAVALIFAAFLMTGLIVAAIMGLATIMPAWLAALIVCALFLLITLIGALIGLRKFKKAMPLLPEDTIRGFKHDLGVVKEGSDYDPSILDPSSEKAKAAKAGKEAEAARAKAEKESKAAADSDLAPAPTETELRRRLAQRRHHLTGVRDDLGEELDVKVQGQALLAGAQAKLKEGQEVVGGRIAALADAASAVLPQGSSGRPELRWKPLAALAASATVFLVLLRKLFKS